MLVLICGVLTSLGGLLGMAFQRKHLLSLLLVMEVVPLGAYCSYIAASSGVGLTFMGLFLLAFSSCAGALGISLLVAVVRVSGCDYVASLNFMKF
uniref:NADH-ubiquinone oxidoreductase chain 4L n=1 Tax=Bryopa lata TaxID=1969317 RepID=A0A1U9XPE2_9BIVA|nr:NADH dehydrogenase subunit 4L [Bryopa lata]AQZ26116.1 NADH dehydrogenase subunit 4L [Bryopa lata]